METAIRSFKVQGSMPEPYTVSFRRSGSKIKAECNCKAGLSKQMCKHRLAIMKGDSNSVIDPNIEHIKEISTWLASSSISDAVTQLEMLEAERKTIDDRIKKIKIQITKAVID